MEIDIYFTDHDEFKHQLQTDKHTALVKRINWVSPFVDKNISSKAALKRKNKVGMMC